ncbi:hypothetical protein SAMD00023353_2001770 [Rosellinia necatrix]|uniref:Uncharacterized protein n=1 Tax=Rosellinia necatrix TaxID=77044 RepID=A0A1W2TEW9_ROSNE|nr:hypothetical protein SAMD00023353_2001770 [Rosellinia necatrix]
MDLEKNLPQTLVKTMGDKNEVAAFDQWRKSDAATSISPSLATPAAFDYQRSLWYQPGSREDLEGAINHYFQQNKQEFSSESTTWQGVLEELDGATAMYHEKVRGNPARATLRRGDTIARTLIPILESIPNDNGLGLLKGGLLVIFNAIKRRSDACEKVFHCFKLIPEKMAHVHRMEKSFYNEKGVKARSEDFYNALISSLPRLIRILNGNESGKRAVRMGKLLLGNQAKDVDSCVELIDEAIRKFDDYISDLNRSRDVRTARITESIHSNVNRLQDNFSETRQDVKDVKLLISYVNDSFEAKRDEYAALRESHMKELKEELIGVVNSFYRLMAEGHRSNALGNEGGISGPSWRTPPTLSWAETIGNDDSSSTQRISEDLIEALGGESIYLNMLNDHQQIIRKYHQFSDKSLRQATYLKSSLKFRRWLMGTAPDILLVDGHETRGRVSAMSVFCAMLVQALWTIQQEPTSPKHQAITLFFTCGAHTSAEDILTGPCGILRSFIGQLLRSWPGHAPDMTFISETNGLLIDDIREDRVEALCYLFEELLGRLPPEAVVYCIIDGISFYETNHLGWSAGLNRVVSLFRELANTGPTIGGLGTKVKSLLVSADKSTDIYRLVSAEKRVDLRARNQAPNAVTEQSLLEEIQLQFGSEGNNDQGNWQEP